MLTNVWEIIIEYIVQKMINDTKNNIFKKIQAINGVYIYHKIIVVIVIL